MSLLGGIRQTGSRIMNWAGPDQFIGTKTNWWKYLALGSTGAAAGIGVYGILRPTYDTQGGSVVTQNAQDPISGMMNSLMPIMMMGLMLPMITSAFKSSKDSKDERNDDE